MSVVVLILLVVAIVALPIWYFLGGDEREAALRRIAALAWGMFIASFIASLVLLAALLWALLSLTVGALFNSDVLDLPSNIDGTIRTSINWPINLVIYGVTGHGRSKAEYWPY